MRRLIWPSCGTLPCLYVIENNRYAMGTSIERASSQTDLSQRGASFGIPGEQVDGMDVEAVYAAGKKAVAHIRSRQRPVYSRNADLSLSRSFHVRSGQIQKARRSR